MSGVQGERQTAPSDSGRLRPDPLLKVLLHLDPSGPADRAGRRGPPALPLLLVVQSRTAHRPVGLLTDLTSCAPHAALPPAIDQPYPISYCRPSPDEGEVLRETTMKKTTGMTIALLLLTSLLAACGGSPPVADEPGTPPGDTGGETPGGNTGGSTVVPAALLGDWQAGAASPIGYYDPNSGAWQGATGSSFILKLRADGSYQYTGLLAVGSGSCQSKILSVERGRAAFDGDTMTFTPSEGDVQSTVCGAPVKHEPVTPSVRRWALSVDDYGREALYTRTQNGSGAADAFYRTDKAGQTFPRIGISGAVTAPEGRSVSGTLVVACYAEDPTCQSPATKIQPVSGSGTFTFPALEDRPYILSAVQDANGNGVVDAGDLVDVYSTTDAPGARPTVRPPADGASLDLVVVQ